MKYKTQMSWGKQNRMNKIFAEDGRTVMLAIDHGYFMGPVTGMEDPAEAVKDLLPYVDALMISPGILNSCITPEFTKGVVLRSSGGSSIAQPDITNEIITLQAEEVAKLNAAAMAVSFYLGTEFEKQTIGGLTKAINDCSKLDLPVLAVTAVGKELEDKRELRFLKLASRIAAEFGSDIVKTYYCDEFEKLTSAVPKPIVVAGGPKLDSNRAVFELVYNAMQKGAAGVDLGRNVWKNPDPIIMIQIINAIVHKNITPDQADEMFKDLKNA
jgi:DhnA family fructose-bisphosphate aldolase class Ia